MSGAEFERRVRALDPTAITVLMVPAADQGAALPALRQGLDNFVTKPLRREVVVNHLRKYSEIVRNRQLLEEIQGMVSTRRVSLSIPNRMELASAAAGYLVREVEDYFDPETQTNLRLGLYELIANAIEHGNLGVDFHEKRRLLEAGPERLIELLEKRAAHPQYAERVVSIEFSMEGPRCEWVIRDEGLGFNWHDVPDPLVGDGIEQVNGRGIFLARFQFDELSYGGRGNRVRAVKLIRPHS